MIFDSRNSDLERFEFPLKEIKSRRDARKEKVLNIDTAASSQGSVLFVGSQGKADVMDTHK